MGDNLDEKFLSPNLGGTYSQKLFDEAKTSFTDKLKTTNNRLIHKTAEETVDLIGDKMTNKITKFLKSWQNNNSQTVTNEHDKEIPKERLISGKDRQNVIYDRRLIYNNQLIMEYQKIINLLDNTPNQPEKFGTKTCVEINDESRGTYKKLNQIRFKTSILRLSFCDSSDTYILVNPIQDGLFWYCSGIGGGAQKAHPSLKSVIHILQY